MDLIPLCLLFCHAVKVSLYFTPTTHNANSFSFRHHSAKHRNVCHSTKYLMLHIRDCPGLLSNGDVCPFPWCRKVKHLLYHLISCKGGLDGNDYCTKCSPEKFSPNLAALVGLNDHRRHKFKERMKAILAKRQQMVAAAAAATVKPKMQHPIGRQLQLRTNPLLASTKPRAAAAKPPSAHLSAVSAPSPLTKHSNGAPVAATIRQPPQRRVPSATPIAVPNSASAAVAASLSVAAKPPSSHRLLSPALSSGHSGMPSMLSVGALPSLEDASLGVDDIGLSASDLMGASAGAHRAVSVANCTTHAPATIVVKTEAADAAT